MDDIPVQLAIGKLQLLTAICAGAFQTDVIQPTLHEVAMNLAAFRAAVRQRITVALEEIAVTIGDVEFMTAVNALAGLKHLIALCISFLASFILCAALCEIVTHTTLAAQHLALIGGAERLVALLTGLAELLCCIFHGLSLLYGKKLK